VDGALGYIVAMPVRIAIVNDYELIVSGLARMLEPHPEIEIVDTAVCSVPRETPIDVVLLDTYGHPNDGLDRLAELVHAPWIGSVAVFSFQTGQARVDAALEAGANSYLSKGLDATQLADALLRTAKGEEVVIAGDARFDGGAWPGRSRGLTERESEVLSLLAQGTSNHGLAQVLGISEHTVKAHLKKIFSKLRFTNRAQAAAFAHTDPEFARRVG
jgi:NarL family two-component system response regulator LiaR